jgi:hypothetical protein
VNSSTNEPRTPGPIHRGLRRTSPFDMSLSHWRHHGTREDLKLCGASEPTLYDYAIAEQREYSTSPRRLSIIAPFALELATGSNSASCLLPPCPVAAHLKTSEASPQTDELGGVRPSLWSASSGFSALDRWFGDICPAWRLGSEVTEATTFIATHAREKELLSALRW